MRLRADGSGAWSVGDYAIDEQLGQGGYGTVYVGIHRRSGQRVAIKKLMRASASALVRFKHEFRALADLHHANLVGLKELIESNGQWFIVMELVDGSDLLEFIGGTASEQDALSREGRVRAAFSGITQGLVALHGHGILHRDLKPSNVRITHEGRAVLLDFGLVTTAATGAQSTEAGGAGTAAYMAPEQAAGAKITPAADWYAFGACLYEALTGTVPFVGQTPVVIMLAKQGKRPRPPSSITHSVARDLEELCMALLDPDPEARPGGRAVLEALDGRGVSTGGAAHPSVPAAAEPFSGRETELEHLVHAMEESEEGEPCIVLVEGESGVGKSALVREFLRRQRDAHPDLLALHGRCYENEQVPYKAFDGCIDELAKVMRKWSKEQCAAVLPRNAGLLPQLFPVLRDVRAFAQCSVEDASADPTARRLEAFSALSGLFARIAETRPVVIVIDDLQWADVESFRMLRAIVEDRARPPLVIVGTARPRGELEGEVAEQLGLVRQWRRTRVLPIVGLPREQAYELARQLLGEGAPTGMLQIIARESKGHPLLLSELVRYAVSNDVGANAALSLEAALAARIRALEPNARALLELVALSGRPYPVRVFAQALGPRVRVEDAARTLLSEKLVQSRRGDQLVSLHDRIRHASVALIAQSRLPLLHRALADAIANLPGVDPTEPARHWDEAGEVALASAAYERAADLALETLAFARAESLYARALALSGGARDERFVRLVIARGHALARSGRSAEAAEAYLMAAEHLQGEERVRLRVHAAQHLIQGAHVERGLVLAREVLADLGVELPTSEVGSLLRLAWQRLRLMARGGVASPSPERSVAAEERLALDALHQLSMPIGWNDILLGAVTNTNHQLRAVGSGDLQHLAFAWGNEAVLRAMQRPNDRAAYEPPLEQSRLLVERCEHPLIEAQHAFVEGTLRTFVFEMNRAEDRLRAAEKILQTQCPGEPWLLTNVRMPLGYIMFMTRRHAALAEKMDAWLREAHERGDRFTLAALRGLGFGFHASLMADQPDAARRSMDECMGPWPSEPFTLAHFGELAAVVSTEVYRGGTAAHRWLTERATRLDRAFMMRTQYAKTWLEYYRGVAALAALGSCAPSERESVRQDARRRVRTLARIKSNAALSFSGLLASQLDALEGELERARDGAARARDAFDALGLHSYRDAMEYFLGVLDGEERGHKRRESLLEAYRAEGWVDPWRGITMHVPAARMLESEAGRSAPARSKSLVAERYEIVGQQGVGGFGAVVEARDVRTGRKLALKELVHKGPSALARFKNEFRALQGVHHPNLLRLDALFEDRGAWYIAMELVEGRDLISWVRENDALDEARLRAAISGLLRGLHALHEAGFVHRDVTPDNVRVTSEGRVVLLDFGLLAGESEQVGDSDNLLGTAEYMAPEQGTGTDAAAAADVYAVGVCLYRALTGRLPFHAPTAIETVLVKRRLAPEPPSTLTSVPSDLEALCMQMLEREPSRRPPIPQVLASLALGSPSPELAALTSLYPAPRISLAPVSRGVARNKADTTFAGRERELDTLLQAHTEARRGAFALVMIEGESGIGKTALVGELALRLASAEPELVVLRSRCYENEDVPYEVFDAAIDDLAQVLRGLPNEDCAALLPKRAALLSQLFPVLGTVPSIRRAPKKGIPVDPAAQRLQAITALCALLANLSARRPVLVVVDDVQWADVESFRLLRSLMAATTAPSMLVVCTLRTPVDLEADVAEELAATRAAPATRCLSLERLEPEASERLSSLLLGPDAPPSRVRAVLSESRGHPLFLRELAAYVADGTDLVETSTLTLEDAILARVQRLGPTERCLLELAAIAGRPHGLEVYARALGQAADISELLAKLRLQRLVRLRRDQQLVCEHSTIRHVVLRAIEPRVMRELCAVLARSLEVEPSTDPSDCARLWDAACDAERAALAYELAADRAFELLAFTQAERFLTRVLKLVGDTRDERWRRLMVKRGRALASTGRSAEAAKAFELAAAEAHGEERTRLRIVATQHAIQGAEVEQGLATARALLAELGLSLPSSTSGALARIGWERTVVAMRGLALERAETREVSSEAHLMLDALHELSAPVGWTDVLAGAGLNTQHLRRALSAGEPEHVARALAQEAAFRAMQNPRRIDRASVLFERARTIARELDSPSLDAFVAWLDATAATFASDPRRALARLEVAHELLHTRCPGEAWLLTNVRTILGATLNSLGEHARLVQLSSEWMAEASERDDRFAMAALSGLGFGFYRHLHRDAPEQALEELDAVMREWPSEPFALAHVGEFYGRGFVAAYRGTRAGYEWLETHREKHDTTFVMKTTFNAMWREVIRAMGAFAAIPELRPDEVAAVRERARAGERRLRRMRLPFAGAFADVVGAQLAALGGRDAQAIEMADRAESALEKLGFVALQHSAMYLRGQLLAGDQGRALRERAHAWAQQQGWADPLRAITMMMPVSRLRQ